MFKKDAENLIPVRHQDIYMRDFMFAVQLASELADQPRRCSKHLP